MIWKKVKNKNFYSYRVSLKVEPREMKIVRTSVWKEYTAGVRESSLFLIFPFPLRFSRETVPCDFENSQWPSY